MKDKKKNFRYFIITAVLAVTLFIAVIIIENSIVNDVKKRKVVYALKDIKSGTEINEVNKEEYFEIREVPEELIMENAVGSPEDIHNFILERDIEKGEQITKNKIASLNGDYKSELQNPVEVSIRVDSIASADAGKLKAGDIVNIVAYSDLLNKTSDVIMENVYITGAYDNNGKDGSGSEADNSNVIFNILIEKERYLDFINATAQGGVQLIKVN